MRRWAHSFLALLLVASQCGYGGAYFLMGKLSWRQPPPGNGTGVVEGAIEFRVDTVWAIGNVGDGLSGRDDFRAEIRTEWAAAVQRGVGALLPVPVTSILLGDGSSLPSDSNSILRMNITRVDTDTVHASLFLTHVYNVATVPGMVNVSFQGCCRPPWLLNNPGMPFRLMASVPLHQAGPPGLISSPILAIQPIVQLRGTEGSGSGSVDAFSIGASHGGIGSVEFRSATGEEMGGGVEDGQPDYLRAKGVSLSSEGVVSATTALSSCPAAPGRCVRHVAVIVLAGDASSALDFMIEVVKADGNPQAPVADYSAFLTTPETSRINMAKVECETGRVSLPSYSAFLVSECIDLIESGSFPCEGYMGVCPPLSYSYVPPFDQPRYISCFSQTQCQPGLHRVYCTQTSSQSAPESTLRVGFHEKDSGQILSRIVSSQSLPIGVMMSPHCDSAGGCGGGWADSESSKFVDISWRPDCDTQLGVYIFCFVGVDAPVSAAASFVSLASKPSCVYVEAVQSIGAQFAWRLPGAPVGGAGARMEAALPVPVGPALGTGIRLVMYRVPTHNVAEEAMIVQPQVACVDENGNLVTLTHKAFISASLGLSLGATLSGNVVADVVRGIATFTDLAISVEGQDFTLRLQAGALGGNATIETPRFTVLPPVRALRFAGGFPGATAAGSLIGSFEPGTGTPLIVPTVYLLDMDNHYAALSKKPVTASIDGVEVYGQTTVYAQSGVASFKNIYVTKAGNFSMKFMSGGFHIMSTYFTVAPGHSAFLTVERQPCAIPCDRSAQRSLLQVAEDVFEMELSLRDKYYNRITQEEASVSVTLRGYPLLPVDSGLLGGCKDMMFTNGIALFTDCSVGHQGFFKLDLVATVGAANLTLRNSTFVFDVQVAVRELKFISQPNTSIAGMPIVGNFPGPYPSIELLDEYGYRTLSRRSIRIDLNLSNMMTTCASACTNASLCRKGKNETCVSPFGLAQGTVYDPVDGVSVMSDTVVLVASKSYTLNIISSDALFIKSTPFEVMHGSGAAIVVSQLPQIAILSEPFVVQPLVSLVDQFGNIVQGDSTGLVECSLTSPGGFLLRGFRKAKLLSGEARFENLAVDVLDTYQDYAGSWQRLTCESYGFVTDSGEFYVADGVRSIEIVSQPAGTVTAGQFIDGALGGFPKVRVLDSADSQMNFSARALAVVVNDSQCANRFPPPHPLMPAMYQAELRGVLPVSVGQPFVLTHFRPIGFDGEEAVLLKVVDGNFDCDLSTSKTEGLVFSSNVDDTLQHLKCNSKNCSSHISGKSYVQFVIRRVPPSGTARVCACLASNVGVCKTPFRVMGLSLHQHASWKLQTAFQVVNSLVPVRQYTDRDNAADVETIWYAGATADSCSAFRTSSSDARVAFALAGSGRQLNASARYECPYSPASGQRYRWASSVEIASLGTIFGLGGVSDLVYPSSECGPITGSRSAFLFSDTFINGKYISASDFESDTLHGGAAMLENPAGLVCILDEPSANCSTLCNPAVGCPSVIYTFEEQKSFIPLDEGQMLVIRLILEATTSSPQLQGYMGEPRASNDAALSRGSYILNVSLIREPASWTSLHISPPTHPELVTWDHTRVITYGGRRNTSWDYSRLGQDGAAFDQEMPIEITCLDDDAWPIGLTLELDLSMVSSVASYNQRTTLRFHKYVDDFKQVPPDSLSVEAIEPPPVPTPPPVLPKDWGESCVRGGAEWAVPGQPETLNRDQGEMLFCGDGIRQIAAGGYHSCAVSHAGYMFCWGRNDYYQNQVPLDIQSMVENLSLGGYHTCAIYDEGKAKCWGDNGQQQAHVPTISGKWQQISAGAAHTCGLETDGTVQCWGDSHYGQDKVPQGVKFQKISAGYFHTCGLTETAGIQCWGGGAGGNQYNFGQIVPPPLMNFSDVSSGNLHTCGIENGSMHCWGSNSYGQSTPPVLEKGVHWIDVSAGLLHTCGVASNHETYCWGSSSLNRLWVLPRVVTPKSKDDPGLWDRVSAGNEHTCGLLASGRISCWGYNSAGQLAVSTAPYVRYEEDGQNSSSVPGVNGLRQIGNATSHIKDVSIKLFVPNPPPIDIFYTTETDGSYPGNALGASGMLRYDVSVTLRSFADSDDPELAPGPISSKQYYVSVATPEISLSHSNGGFYSTNATLTVDTLADSLNPTEIHYTLDGREPTTSDLPYNVSSPVVLDAATGNSSGYSTIKVRAFRGGALDSLVAVKSVLISAAKVVVTHSGVAHETSDGVERVVIRTAELSVFLSTPETSHIQYKVCAPSNCPTYPNISSISYTTYTGAFNLSQNGTIVSAKASVAGLADSAVVQKIYVIATAAPEFAPNPYNLNGYLAPLQVTVTCSSSAKVGYIVGNGNTESIVGSSSFIIELLAPTNISARCVRDNLASSVVLDRQYTVTDVAFTSASISESTNVAGIPNEITVKISMTQAVTRGSRITLSGLRGSGTPNNNNLPISNPYLSGSWVKEVLTLTMKEDLPQHDVLFAVTNSSACAERLPYGPSRIASNTSTTAYLSTSDKDLLHGKWIQKFYTSATGAPVMSITYEFQTRPQTLKERMSLLSTQGQPVKWTVTYGGVSRVFQGRYRFSSAAGLTASSTWSDEGHGFSSDDGAWGALDQASSLPALDGTTLFPEGFFLGQGVFETGDLSAGACGVLYLGTNTPIRTSTLTSRIYMSELYSDLAFSFVLFNPARPQPAVSATLALSGSFCAGCAETYVPSFLANGTVLGAQLSFSIIDGSIKLAPGASGAASAYNVITVAIRSNVPFPASGMGTLVPGLDTITKLTISGLTGSGTFSTPNLPVGFDGKTVFEEILSFSCTGYQDCVTTIRDYRPSQAVVADAKLSVHLSCSDFNSADEYLESMFVDGVKVATQQKGWLGCEGACHEEKTVISEFSLAGNPTTWAKLSNGQAIDVRLKASPAVDSNSCSQTAAEYVHARVVLSISYFFSGEWDQQKGRLVYQVRQSNQNQPCMDDVWKDSAGFSCSDYEGYKWCSRDGSVCGGTSGMGASWTCEQFAYDGKSARQACCACSGGASYWTKLSFSLRNGPVPRKAVLPNVTLSVDMKNGVIITPNPGFDANLRIIKDAPGVLGVCDNGGLECLTDRTSPSGRRLLQSLTSLAKPQRRLLNSDARVELDLQLAWSGAEREWLYSCCWDDLKVILAKAVADTVGSLDYRSHVNVVWGATSTAGAHATVTLIVDSARIAVVSANQLRESTVQVALSAQRVYVTVSFASRAKAYDFSNNLLPLEHVEYVGNVTVSARYESNAAMFPLETLSSYSQKWDIGHILVDHVVAVSSAGIGTFNGTVVKKACNGYRMVFLTDTGLTVTSSPFSVVSAAAAALKVSPIPTIQYNAACSCGGSPACRHCDCLPRSSDCLDQKAQVVAGLYFAVTATVVDRFENLVMDEHNGDTVVVQVYNNTEKNVVYGVNAVDSKLVAGNVTLSLRLLKTSPGLRLQYFVQGTNLSDISQPFSVIPGPLTRLRLNAPALEKTIYAGQDISPPPEVFIYDTFNNSIPYNLTCTASLLNAPGILLVDYPRALSYGARKGRAFFPLTRIEKAGVYVWSIASSTSIKVFSSSFIVTAALIDPENGQGIIQLAIQPGGAIAEEAFSVQPKLRVVDKFGNVASSFDGAAEVVHPNATMTGSNTSLRFVGGTASFTDLAIAKRGTWTLTFVLGTTINVTSIEFEVRPKLASIAILQQPTDTSELSCMEPAPLIMLMGEDGHPADYSRQEVTIAFSQNAFRYTQHPSCGTGGCTASTTFRYFVPQGGTLVAAFLDVQIAKTDFNDDNEEVELISVNGLPVMKSCNPGEAQQCDNLYPCMSGFDVTELAVGNVVSISITISAAVNEWCYPRLKARVDFYGSYRPAVPERYYLDQTGNKLPIEGVSQLVATGRTLAFNSLAFPAQGLGYRLHFSTPSGVSVETDGFNVVSIASKLEVNWKSEDRYAIAGEAFASQPKVRFLDARGKLVASMISSVAVSIISAETLMGQAITGVTLMGKQKMSASGGQVSFTDLYVDAQVDVLTLQFSEVCAGTGCANLNPVQSDAVQIESPVTRLSINWTVPTFVTAGRAINGPPSVSLLDSDGNIAYLSTRKIAVSALNSTGQELNLFGDTIVTAAAGYANFYNVAIRKVGQFSVKFSFLSAGVGLAGAFSQTFTVLPGPTATIFSDPRPSFRPYSGSAFEIIVRLRDEFGNDVVTDYSTFIVARSQNTDLYSGLNAEQSMVKCAEVSGVACARAEGGTASLWLRIEDVAVVNITLAATFRPSGTCSHVPTSALANCDHPLAMSTSGARTYCETRFNTLQGECAAIPFCTLAVGGGTCLGACQCVGNVKTSSQNCHPCFVTTHVTVVIQPNPSAGFIKIGMVRQPVDTADGIAFTIHPQVLVQQCLKICFPVTGLVAVSVITAESGISLGGTLEAQANSNGIATFNNLYVSGVTISAKLFFTTGTSNVTSNVFRVGPQNNVPPQLILPSPGLCEDRGVLANEPLKFYVMHGSSFSIEIKARDDNQNPYDDITIELLHGKIPGYFTENVYDAGNVELTNFSYTCGGTIGSSSRMQVIKNRVSRYFIWSPVDWFPPFTFVYYAKEAKSFPAETCKVTVSVEVCQRPSFVVSREPAVVGLASAPVALTIKAVDLNDDDIVTIEDLSDGVPGHTIQSEVYDQVLGVDGLTRVFKNRVSRTVELTIPSSFNDPLQICFGVRDNSFTCDFAGLVGEDEMCITCTLDSSGVTGSCQSEMRSSSLYQRSHVSVCGDKRVTGAETCDDGNHISNDGCSSLCVLEQGFELLGSHPEPFSICGDGLVVVGETCDDMNTVVGDGCFNCMAEVGYECGSDSISQQFLCCFTKCGDGLVIPPETCDDGNLRDGDGCDSKCISEPGFQCPNGICVAACGDGNVKGAEKCDDHNENWGDGCSDICTVEAGFECDSATQDSMCLPIYGDGLRVFASSSGIIDGKYEECDDGNFDAGDGCHLGRVETGFFCCPVGTYPDSCGCPYGTFPQSCTETSTIFEIRNGTRTAWTSSFEGFAYDECSDLCGDSIVVTAIPGLCDDGDWITGDGCSGCVVEDGWECEPYGAVNGPCRPKCGDGRLMQNEACDDGNLQDKDGCSSECTVEEGFKCTELGCSTFCGDGIRVSPEECDDNNTMTNDGCSGNCLVEEGWYCVGSTELVYDVCSGLCGDGIRVEVPSAQEECDDGAWSRAWGDGCTDSCLKEVGFTCLTDEAGRLIGGKCSPNCGDGLWVLGERCDDGNVIDGDGCSSQCEEEEGWTCSSSSGQGLSPPTVTDSSICMSNCPDGIKVGMEECDDGNSDPGDGCSPSCTIEPGFVCGGPNGEQQKCTALCGDGVVVGKEFCDDKNDINGDGCSNCLVEPGWECIPANCSGILPGERCRIMGSGVAVDTLVFGVGSACESCPPVRFAERRCSHPPCPPAEITQRCDIWRLYDDGGWVRVQGKDDAISGTCKSQWSRDGYCDPLNNNEACGWDGGDCCSSTCNCGNTCYNGNDLSGCGSFEGEKGGYHCLDPGLNVGEPTLDITVGGAEEIKNGVTLFISQALVSLTTSSAGTTIYYTTDGTQPAEERAGERVILGKIYEGAFQVTSGAAIKASAVLPGLRISTVSKDILLKVALPEISPPSNANMERLPSPLQVEITCSTPGASIFYSLIGGGSLLYTGPFFVYNNENVSAVARKNGLIESDVVFSAYSLVVDAPVITPNGSTPLQDFVTVEIQSRSVQSQVVWSICSVANYTRLVNKTLGETIMKESDECYSLGCKGICRGGSTNGAACMDENDVFTCKGENARCSIEYHLVNLCDPLQWPRGSKPYVSPITINSTFYGTRSIIAAAAKQPGLESSRVVTATFILTASTPTLVSASTTAVILAPSASAPGFLISPAEISFIHPAPRALILYTLDGSQPSLDLNPLKTYKYMAGSENVVFVNVTSTVTAIVPGGLLESSGITREEVIVQLAPPSVQAFVLRVPSEKIALSAPFIHPRIGQRSNSDDFWWNNNIQVDVTASLNHNMHNHPGVTVLYKITLGIDPEYQATGAGVYYNDSVAGMTTSQLVSQGWKTYQSGKTLILGNTSTLWSVAMLKGARSSYVARIPVFVRSRCQNGFTSSDGLEPCSPCAIDSFKKLPCDKEWNCQCESCPDGTGTATAGSEGSISCQPQCSLGTYSEYGLDIKGVGCLLCPKATYADQVKTKKCVQCPAGTTTLQEGSTEMFQCVGSAALSAGGFHTCGVVSATGEGLCWGYDVFTQAQVPKTASGGLYEWLSLDAGSFYSCGITVDGLALCWGQDFAGKTLPPKDVTSWSSVYTSKGYHHTCGRTAERKARCWGDSQYNQTTVPGVCQNVPIALVGQHCDTDVDCGGSPAVCEHAQSWMSLSPGQFHTCGVHDSGRGYCWGDNTYGQSRVPRKSNGLHERWRDISSGHYHSCGVTDEGKAICWGSSIYGATDVPTGVNMWSSISAGRFHSCGITASGDARCWGSSQDKATEVPALASGSSSWLSITSGLFHSCAVDDVGRGYCWGRNVYGMLRVPTATVWRQ